MPMQRAVRLFVLSSIALMLVGLAVWYSEVGPGGRGDDDNRFGLVVPGGVEIGGPFSLIDHTGRPVTEELLSGTLSLIYFGYTFCPDFCPTDLQKMAVAIDGLGDRMEWVQPIFITIDPARDTVAALSAHVSLFHPRLLGLTGADEDVAKAAKAYRVYYRRADADDENYLMDHSLYMYLMGPDGRLIELFGTKTSPETLTAALNHYLDAAAAGGPL